MNVIEEARMSLNETFISQQSSKTFDN